MRRRLAIFFRKLVRKIIFKYRHTTLPRWWIFALDILLFAAAFAITEMFHYRYAPHVSQLELGVKFGILLLITVMSFGATGTYRSIIRHSGLADIYTIMASCIIPAAFIVFANIFNNNYNVIKQRFLPSYGELFQIYSFTIVLMIVVRLFCQRIYNDYFKQRRPTRNIVIYGAGAAGLITQEALSQDLATEYKIVAFVDDDVSKIGKQLNSVPVLGAATVLSERFVNGRHVEELVIAMPTAKSDQRRSISSKALELGLKVKSVPHISLWIDGTFSASQIEDIKIEDLLERESINIGNANITREIDGKSVLVTGAAGSIGSEICRQLTQYNPSRIIMLDQAESPMYDLQYQLRNTKPYSAFADRMEFVIANIKDLHRMDEVMSLYKPQIIFHAAAYKHVPFMEENPCEAVFVNVFGTKNLADLAIKYQAQKFVMISTDKAVNPTNVMGASKRMAEIYTQSRNSSTHFITTRFGNVLGSNGSVIPLFKKQLAAGGPLTVTHKDIIRYFMTIPEACNLVLEAGSTGNGGDIFVFDMGEPVKIYDLAKRMIQISGLQNIQITEIGLRPGEKLYEELLSNKENTIPTHHPKILKAKVREYPADLIDSEYQKLWQILTTENNMQIVEQMKSIVPEFISNNSVYCQLDKTGKNDAK